MTLKIKPSREELREKDEEHAGRWLITYCSLAITLVAVFMMLVSYSSVASGKMTKYRRSIGQYGTQAGASRVQGTADPAESAIATLRHHAQMSGYTGQVEITRTQDGFKVTVPGSALFEPDTAEVQEEAHPLLAVMTGIMKRGFFSLGIAGHTSRLPACAEDFSAGLELSGNRAAGLLKHFLESGRIPAYRLACVGYGPYRPSASGGAEARDKNDRIEFLFIIRQGA